MFTGIIEDVGTVRDIDDRGESMRLRIDSPIMATRSASTGSASPLQVMTMPGSLRTSCLKR